MTRADRFIRIYTWIGFAGGALFLLVGTWLLWVAQSSILLILGLLTLTGSLAARRKHEALRTRGEKEEEPGFPLSRE